MVNNSTSVEPEEGIKIIQQLFIDLYPDYTIKKQYNWGGFYGFGVIIEKNDIEIMLGGARGFLEGSLKISNQIIVDWQEYDKKMEFVKYANKENFHFVAFTIKEYLDERNVVP